MSGKNITQKEAYKLANNITNVSETAVDASEGIIVNQITNVPKDEINDRESKAGLEHKIDF